MKLIAGLGNPGKKYQNNRHNIGYIIADEFAREENLQWRYNPDWIAYYIKDKDICILKPAAYMNKSGVSVISASKFYKIDKKDILVVHDDLDLPFGKIRLSFDSISAGHRGIDSVIESLSGVEFGRLRIGIGHPTSNDSRDKKKDTEKYVLSDFTKDERKEIKSLMALCVKAVKSYLADGIDATMNRFN